ncbi:MAG: hypothetical protein P8N56_01215 [Schleiferiaceae bacterium]|nr:hypothetical protein [Schleiferiaceae bacterium]
MNGEYKEGLPFGQGELIVSKNSHRIQFYFPGPDLRYNGTFLKISSSEIDSYIDAYQENWKKFEEMKVVQKQLDGELNAYGKLNMIINVGGWHSGVCIHSYHMPLKSEKEIKSIIDSLCWAQKRGPEIKSFLKSLD